MVDSPFDTFLGAFTLFREAILCAVLAGAALGWLGVHVVLRRMVFVTATLTQAAGLGVALAFWSGIVLGQDLPPVLGAAAASLAAAALLSLTPTRLRLSRESIMAAVWLGASALAVLVGNRITQEAHDIAGILFGSAVLVLPSDLWMVAATAVPALLAAGFLHRRLVFAGFDPDGARVQGLPVRGLDLLFLGLLTLVVAAATRALGALPVFAFSVLPGLAALLLLPTLRGACPLAAGLGALAGGVGFVAAFVLDLPVGATQAALALGVTGLAAVWGVVVGATGGLGRPPRHR